MGQVVLVTGGAKGIGAGVARRMVAEGWRVVVADLEACEVEGARGVVCDVGVAGQVQDLVEGIEADEGRLDGVVCNAGIMIRKPIGALSVEEWGRVLATNLTSAFLVVRAAEGMLRRAKGAVVTVASTRARMSEPDTEAYAASKGGIVALSHALAVSLGPDVRVNVVSPGWIDVRGEALREADHAQHPAGRVGRAEDVAGMVAFLLGPEAGFVTGAEFVVDGGMTRKMIYVD